VVILDRGGAGKSGLARQLSDVTGIPAVELDALFWQPGPTPMDPSRWAACQHELVQRSCWILDGDLGPYDTALEVRLRAADTIVVLDFTFLRCAWRTLRAGTILALGAGLPAPQPPGCHAGNQLRSIPREALRPAQSRHGAALRRRSPADSRARTPQRVSR